MSVSITHNKTGNVKTFSHPREAQAWVEDWLAQKFSMDEITIENNYGVALTAYHSRIVPNVSDLIERVELAHGGNLVPEWHWIWSKKGYSTGRTLYSRRTLETKKITITACENAYDYVGVILHEMAHALTTGEHHGRNFYRTLFQLLRTYASPKTEEHTIKREFQYKKSSKYWYGEMYNVEEILSLYRPVRVAAARLTREQQTQLIAESMFADLEN